MDFFPRHSKTKICTNAVQKFCKEYILKTRDNFLLSVIAVVAVIVGVGLLLMALASMMVGNTEDEQMDELHKMDRYYDARDDCLFGFCLSMNIVIVLFKQWSQFAGHATGGWCATVKLS